MKTLIINSLLFSNKFINNRGRTTKLYSEPENPKLNIRTLFKIGRTASVINTANDVASFSNNYGLFSDKFKEYMTKNEDVVNPKYYTTQINHEGSEWTLTKLIEYINDDMINGISIDKEGMYALVIDKYNGGNISPDDIHYVSLIPSYVNNLIDLLIKHKIPLDFI